MCQGKMQGMGHRGREEAGTQGEIEKNPHDLIDPKSCGCMEACCKEAQEIIDTCHQELVY